MDVTLKGRYAELQVISNYSFLQGASHPHELVEHAAKLGYGAIALSDECSLAGIVKAHVAAKNLDIKLIVGSQFKLHDPEHPEQPIKLIALVPSKQAYHQLSSLITLARRRCEKGDYFLKVDDISHIADSCLHIWLPADDLTTALSQGKTLKKHLYRRLWLGHHSLQCDHEQARFFQHQHLAEMLELPSLACNNVHMHIAKRKPLLDILHAIKQNSSVQKLGHLLQQNSELHLRSLRQLQAIYPQSLLEETVKVAELCNFSLDEIRYEYPSELVPPSLSPHDYLRKLCEQGIKKRWPKGIPERFCQILEKELQLIKEMAYEYYFLTVYDIVMFARSQNILCQGRGSAANSIVCYCLFITEVSPEKFDMLFERFISKERDAPPDIDVDFEHQRREEVIQYIYKKYSRERAGLAASVVTYKPKSAIRDVAKALDIHPNVTEKLLSNLSWWDRRKDLFDRFAEQEVNDANRLVNYFSNAIEEILGFPRHLSQHVGGFIITKSPLSTLVPVENAAMAQRSVIQWDKDDIEAMGLLKIDVLALGMLTAIHKALDMINSYSKTPLTLATIPGEDPATYQMLSRADSIGVFQVESRAQMSMLPRLKPRTFYDLVIEVAIVRPGPIQGEMVHPYLKRRSGEEKPSYPNATIKQVLERTLGVPIFQEQVIKLAMVAANFSGGEADQLRRAMASWGKNGQIEFFEQKLIKGMLGNGYSLAFAKRLFQQIKGFSGYGFPESHSASFALLVYISAWIKRHHPTAFYCALLNSQPMGFYSPSQLIQDAQRHRIIVLEVDLYRSEWECTLSGDAQLMQPHRALQLGFNRIKGLGQACAERIIQARSKQAFSSIEDLKRRGKLNKRELELLIGANALHQHFGDRKQAHWQAQAIESYRPLLHEEQDETLKITKTEPLQTGKATYIKPESAYEKMLNDYQSTAVCVDIHPLSLLRKHYPFNRCTLAKDMRQLRHQQFIRIAGLVTCRQRPSTAAGVLFLTLEDESGNINVVVWKSLFPRFRQALIAGNLLMIKGHLEKKDEVMHVIAGNIIDMSDRLSELAHSSRDFH